MLPSAGGDVELTIVGDAGGGVALEIDSYILHRTADWSTCNRAKRWCRGGCSPPRNTGAHTKRCVRTPRISAYRAKIFFARCARAEKFRSPRGQIDIYARDSLLMPALPPGRAQVGAGGRGGGGFADERPRSMFRSREETAWCVSSSERPHVLYTAKNFRRALRARRRRLFAAAKHARAG